MKAKILSSVITDNILTYVVFRNGHTVTEHVDISNDAIKNTTLSVDQVRALLKTDEYRWINDWPKDPFNHWGSEVVHRCWKVTGSNYHVVNVSSNPGYGSCYTPATATINTILPDGTEEPRTFYNCVLEVEDEEDGNWKIDLRRGPSITCPRCHVIWQIQKTYKETCPWYFRLKDRLIVIPIEYLYHLYRRYIYVPIANFKYDCKRYLARLKNHQDKSEETAQ